MGVFDGSGVRGSGLLRRGASTLLGAYGRSVLVVAERVDPRETASASVRRLPGVPRASRAPRAPRGATDGPSDARSADMLDLRRLALDATIAASQDPARSAQVRLGEATVNLSDWAAGRLLGEAMRMREASLEIVTSADDTVRSASADDTVRSASAEVRSVTRRQFDVEMRRRFPWLDEGDAARLFDHAVLASYRNRRDSPAAPDARVAPVGLVAPVLPGPIGRIGALVDRLRLRA